MKRFTYKVKPFIMLASGQEIKLTQLEQKMKLRVVNEQIGFIGKTKELPKIEKALNVMAEELGVEFPFFADNGDEDLDFVDLGFLYCNQSYTVADVKAIWNRVKKSI